jgi:hypothetical protein
MERINSPRFCERARGAANGRISQTRRQGVNGKPKNRNCYTCKVRKENCGKAKKLSPADWTRHVCVMWFPRDDMGIPALNGAEQKMEREQGNGDC